MNWIEYLDSLRDDAGALAKQELKGLLQSALVDTNGTVSAIAGDVKKYLEQLGNGQITKAQFLSLMDDQKTVARMKARREAVEVKARLQKLADGIERLLINGLSKLL
jgi:hypothetical protein